MTAKKNEKLLNTLYVPYYKTAFNWMKLVSVKYTKLKEKTTT